MLEAGLEPARPLSEHRILNPGCLPVPPLQRAKCFYNSHSDCARMNSNEGFYVKIQTDNIQKMAKIMIEMEGLPYNCDLCS